MIKFVILAIFVAGTYGAHVRIINGTDAEEGEFPFASVLLRNGSFYCGSSILNERFILTAAHCACPKNESVDSNLFSIQYGLRTRVDDGVTNVIKVKEVTCNNYNDYLEYDTAVLELESPIPKDSSWEPVKLAKTFESFVEQKGVIIGWGLHSLDGDLPTTLQKIDVTIFNDQLCGKQFNPFHHICIGTEIYGGICNGDSGSALLFNGVQVGIASFIVDTCGIANKFHPNCYARVPIYYNWIQVIAGDVTFV